MAQHAVESLVTGRVWKVESSVGQQVQEGDVLLILESMKMEIPIESPASGTLTALNVAVEQTVAEGEILAVVES
jgi:biotin carboxyl carrier protein